MRVERIGDATLYLGDCFEILPTLPEVDAVITDPPYGPRTHAMAKTNRGAGHGTRLVRFDSIDPERFEEACGLCLRASGGWVVLTCDFLHVARLYDKPEFVRLGAWVKPNPMPQISADRPGMGFETVAILHSGKRPKAWNRGGGSGVWTFSPHSAGEVETQKPLGLALAFVSDFTTVGEIVADPFMGSGTTGVASLRRGRGFVGIEADPKHFDIACQRIDAEQRQGAFTFEKSTAA